MTQLLPTSEPAREPSLLARLRRLMPRRPLSFQDAKRVAELQASTLLRERAIPIGRVSEQLIAELPRIDVQYRDRLPGSGFTTWERGAWRIGINRSEPAVRQRFTLAHELKHVLDASHEDAVYGHLPKGPSRDRHVEAVCDHFAACLLMPRAWVKRLWGEGIQDLSLLARHFDVSQAAMHIRLQNLGLVEPQPRAASPPSGASPCLAVERSGIFEPPHRQPHAGSTTGEHCCRRGGSAPG